MAPALMGLDPSLERPSISPAVACQPKDKPLCELLSPVLLAVHIVPSSPSSFLAQKFSFSWRLHHPSPNPFPAEHEPTAGLTKSPVTTRPHTHRHTYCPLAESSPLGNGSVHGGTSGISGLALDTTPARP